MHRLFVVVAALALVTPACASTGTRRSQGGPATRRVLVDYADDRFASYYLAYYPRSLEVRPGDTVQFRQAWNGEPHSVTMGSLVDRAMGPTLDLLQRTRKPILPGQIPPEVQSLFDPLPGMIDEHEQAQQSAAQPCFLDVGAPPVDINTPCPQVTQPEFNGRQSYFSSGFIPYTGNRANSFTMKLADDIAPGTYRYYCNLHGPTMWGQLLVRAKGTRIPSQGSVDQAARTQANKAATTLLKSYERALGGRVPADLKGKRLAGWSDEASPETGAAEFIPRKIETKTGQPVTWAFFGPHTVSFNVPPYFPLITVAPDGNVTVNTRGVHPVESPDLPSPSDQRARPTSLDAGPWDGRGFKSSGLGGRWGPFTYTTSFTRPGTFRYACLIHPRMVGTIVVR